MEPMLHRRGVTGGHFGEAVNETEFRAELAEIRLRCERVLTQNLSVEQLAGLGAELHVQTEAILRDLAAKGKMGWRVWI